MSDISVETRRELERLSRTAARSAGLPVGVLTDFLPALATGRRPDEATRDRFAAIGGRASDDDIGLGTLVELYLSTARRAWPRLLALTGRTPGAGPAGEADVQLLRVMEELVSAVAAGHGRARALASRGQAAWRRELVDDLLAGTTGADSDQRAETLGFRLSEPHTLLAVAADRPLTDDDREVRVLREGLHRRTRAPVLVAAKDGVLVALLPASRSTSSGAAGIGSVSGSTISGSVGGDSGAGGRTRRRGARVALVRPRLAVGELATLAYELITGTEAGSANGWRVVGSRPRPGAAAVAASWQEVRQTLTLASRLGLPDPVIPASRLDAYRLILSDPDAARRLADEVLGPLRSARGGAMPMIDTLLAVFDHGGNTGAARALHVSVRTVLYRLARVADLTTRDPADPADRFTLYVAALASRLTELANTELANTEPR